MVNSLDVRLCHFNSLSHVLHITTGNNGGQAVCWEKTTKTGIRSHTITFLQRKQTTLFCILDPLPSVVHDRLYVITKIEGLALMLFEVFLHPWNTSLLHSSQKQVLLLVPSLWGLSFCLFSCSSAEGGTLLRAHLKPQFNTFMYLQDLWHHNWFIAN